MSKALEALERIKNNDYATDFSDELIGIDIETVKRALEKGGVELKSQRECQIRDTFEKWFLDGSTVPLERLGDPLPILRRLAPVALHEVAVYVRSCPRGYPVVGVGND